MKTGKVGPGRWAGVAEACTKPSGGASALGSAVPVPPSASHWVSLSAVALGGQAKGPRYRSPMLTFMFRLLPTLGSTSP